MLWIVLGWFLNLIRCSCDADFTSSKVMYLSFYWAVSAHLFDCYVSDDDWAGLAICWFWCHLCVEDSTGVFFEFIFIILGVLFKSDASWLFLGYFCPPFDFLYLMMLGSVQQYGGLGVNWLPWMVLGWVLNSFL